MSQLLEANTDSMDVSLNNAQRDKLIFEHDTPGVSGVDVEDCDLKSYQIGPYTPRSEIGLPDIAEPTLVRHYTRLSKRTIPSTRICIRLALAQ